MNLALYRKYRPTTFDELASQEHIKTTLANEISSGAIAHAYIFHGPRGTGKTTTARLFAKAINCLDRKDKSAEPCGKCSSCETIANKSAIDIIEIDAASQTQVEKTRENIINDAQVAPGQLKYKIFIIDEVHMLSTASFNALLKTLEEPPAHAIFIMATTEIHKVPETILSRCQIFNFHKVSNEDLKKRLEYILKQEKKKLDDQILDRIIQRAEGGVRDAESLLGQVLSLGEKVTPEQADLVLPRSSINEAIEIIDLVLQNKASDALNTLYKTVDQGILHTQLLEDLIKVARNIMLTKAGITTENAELYHELWKTHANLAVQKIVEILNKLMQVQQVIKLFDMPLLPLEMMIMELTSQDQVVEPPQAQPVPESVKKNETPTETPKAEAKPVESSHNGDWKTTLSQLEQKWEEIAEEVTKLNVSVAALIRMVVPVAINDGMVELRTPFKFYHKRFNDLKNQQMIVEILMKKFNEPLRVNCEVDESVKLPDRGNEIMNDIISNTTAEDSPMPEIKEDVSPKKEGSDIVDQVLDIIGGEVVEEK